MPRIRPSPHPALKNAVPFSSRRGNKTGIQRVSYLIFKTPVFPAGRVIHKPPAVIAEFLSPPIRERIDKSGNHVFFLRAHIFFVPSAFTAWISRPDPAVRHSQYRKIRHIHLRACSRPDETHKSFPGSCEQPPDSSFRPHRTSTTFLILETTGSSHFPKDHNSTSFRRPDHRTASPPRGNHPY